MDCLSYAVNTFIRRAHTDYNPGIMQLMDSTSHPRGHWFYLSADYIATTPFNARDAEMPGFQGKIVGCPDMIRQILDHHGYIGSIHGTEIARKLKISGKACFREYFH